MCLCRTWRRNVALLALCGVAEPPGVTGRGVKTWRHCLMWRHADTLGRRTWRQNVASQTHAASLSHLAAPNRASKRGVTGSRGMIYRPPGSDSDDKKTLAVGESSPYVASVRGVRSLRGVRTPRVVKPGGVKTWRQASHTDVASRDVASVRGVRGSGPGQNVSSKRVFRRRAKCAPPWAPALKV